RDLSGRRFRTEIETIGHAILVAVLHFRLQSHEPNVQATDGWFRHRREITSHPNGRWSALTCQDAGQDVIAGSAERFLPNLRAARVQPEKPEIGVTEPCTGLVSAGRRAGSASQQETTVSSKRDLWPLFLIASAKGGLPLLVPSAVQTQQPEVRTAVCRRLFVAIIR